ncbi:MAG: hypothetical protein QG618_1213, partial [Thermodesulfobacteriota bacterium]|nr:hypothetical protein [Thermodesulfobacteriota bacterium]
MLTIIYNSILWNSSVCNATASRTLAKKKEIIGFIGHIFYPCNHQDIRRALINSQIDSIGLQFEEYLYISDHFETEHWFLTRTSGTLYEEYVLLAPVDGKIKQCEDLIGNNLIFYNSPRTCLAGYWLKSIIKGINTGYNGLEPNVNITKTEKISKAVLPVFFDKADACSVTNSGLSTMIELNPQIGRKFRIIM